MSRSEEFTSGHGVPAFRDLGGPPPPRSWEKPHEELVHDALHSWKGWPSDVRNHMAAAEAGAPEPDSGSGKHMRAQAAALLHELKSAPPNDRPLYRGSHVEPSGVSAWTDRKSVAHRWARWNNGKVFTLPKGSVPGVRIRDHISSGADEIEREWIVHKPQGYTVSDPPQRKPRRR